MVHGAIIAGAVAGVAAAVTFEVTVFAPWRAENWPAGVAAGLRSEWASFKAEFRDVVGGADPHAAHAQAMEARARRRREREETQEEAEARDLRELREEIEQFEMHERQSAVVRRRMREEFDAGFASGAQKQQGQEGMRRRNGASARQQDDAPALPPKPSSPSSSRAASSRAPRSPSRSGSGPLIDLHSTTTSSKDAAAPAPTSPSLSLASTNRRSSHSSAAHPDSGPPTPRSHTSSSPRAVPLPFHASLSSHDAMLAPPSVRRSSSSHSGSARSHGSTLDDGASDFAIVSPPRSVAWSEAAFSSGSDAGVGGIGAAPLSRGPSSLGTPSSHIFDDADPFDEAASHTSGHSGMFHSAERDESAWRMPGASTSGGSRSGGARSETALSDEDEWERLSYASASASATSPRAHMRALRDSQQQQGESRL